MFNSLDANEMYFIRENGPKSPEMKLLERAKEILQPYLDANMIGDIKDKELLMELCEKGLNENDVDALIMSMQLIEDKEMNKEIRIRLNNARNFLIQNAFFGLRVNGVREEFENIGITVFEKPLEKSEDGVLEINEPDEEEPEDIGNKSHFVPSKRVLLPSNLHELHENKIIDKKLHTFLVETLRINNILQIERYTYSNFMKKFNTIKGIGNARLLILYKLMRSFGISFPDLSNIELSKMITYLENITEI